MSSNRDSAAPPAPAAAAGWIIFTHLASAGVMLGWVLWAKESPRPVIYGLFVNYFYRMVTLGALHQLQASGSDFGRGLARRLTRPPHPQRPSYQVTVGEGASAVPAGFGIYCLVIGLLAALSVVLLNVADQKFVTPAHIVAHEFGWGLLLGLLWWLLDLVDRRITLRFDEDLKRNLGYNSSDITFLAFTVLTGGVASGIMGSPWPYFLALVAWKTFYDAWDEVHYPRGEHLRVP